MAGLPYDSLRVYQTSKEGMRKVRYSEKWAASKKLSGHFLVCGQWLKQLLGLQKECLVMRRRLMLASVVAVIGSVVSGGLLCAQESIVSPEEQAEGFVPLFDGKTLTGWQGDLTGYVVEDGKLVCTEKGRFIYTDRDYDDFVLRLQYKIPPGGNNGIIIRAPLEGNPSYTGMEIQILDDYAAKWANLKPEQYNGSIYGAVAAKRGHLKPAGEWNDIEIYAKGHHIRVTLNGAVIVDADVSQLGEKSIHGHQLTGLKRLTGRIGFAGHGDRVEFRNIRIKELK